MSFFVTGSGQVGARDAQKTSASVFSRARQLVMELQLRHPNEWMDAMLIYLGISWNFKTITFPNKRIAKTQILKKYKTHKTVNWELE